MKKILGLLLIGMLTIVSAVDTNDVAYAGFGDLTTQEQAEIVKLVADKKAKAIALAKVPPIQKAEELERWVNLGSSIGKGLASSAKELGVQVNEFSETSVGKWTMFLIVFNIVGNELINIFGGLIFLFFGIIFTTVMLNRRHRWDYTYHDTGKVKTKKREPLSSDATSWFLIAYIVIIGISMLIMTSS